jgi:hypothetical protein
MPDACQPSTAATAGRSSIPWLQMRAIAAASSAAPPLSDLPSGKYGAQDRLLPAGQLLRAFRRTVGLLFALDVQITHGGLAG